MAMGRNVRFLYAVWIKLLWVFFIFFGTGDSSVVFLD
jgi:hypothetical protein